MSKEEDKVKHSKRIHADKVAVKKQIKIAKAHGLDEELSRELKYETNRFAKHHSVDFGFDIAVKNPRKTLKQETIQEKRAKQDKVELE